MIVKAMSVQQTTHTNHKTQATDYISIAHEYQYEYTIEKSRFIATLVPCQTEEDAQVAIKRLAKHYWDARHNCSAYAIGPCQEQQRSSDDGEPSGTAGKPMLEVLKKTEITNVAVVVTRYFGGIKLGTGGLIRAYSHTVAEAIRQAPKELHTKREKIETSITYTYLGTTERYLQDHDYTYHKDFTDTVQLTIYIAPHDYEKVTDDLMNITNGTVTITHLGNTEVIVPIKD